MNIKEMHDLAGIDPFQSVVKSNEIFEGSGTVMGVKNDFHINPDFISSLTKDHKYQLHTIDAMAAGGRAVDLSMINPITGRYMSGSSSGTAVNVFLGMNEIGIGSDGGGSVLAPAMSLNLFGFISYLICAEYMDQYKKESTDGIRFRPSIGYISYDFPVLWQLIKDTLPVVQGIADKIVVSDIDNTDYPFSVTKYKFPDIYGRREDNITFLQTVLPDISFLISKEGPVDVNGFGDTVFGHFDERTKQIQREANKGFIRTVNMAKATSITVPTGQLGDSYVGICESKPEKIWAMIDEMEKLIVPKDTLTERYFRNIETWKRKGYGE